MLLFWYLIKLLDNQYYRRNVIMKEQADKVIKQQEINLKDGTFEETETPVNSSVDAKSAMDNVLLSILNFASKPWHKALSTLTFNNKFSVITLLLFFVAGFLPAIKLFSESQSLYELIEASNFQIMILLVAALYAMGVKRSISKVASIILVLIIFYNINEAHEMAASFVGSNRSFLNENTLNMILESMRYGLVIWLISLVSIMILSVLPFYTTNTQLWPTLVEIFNTQSTSTVNVKEFTGRVNDNIQSAVKKGHQSIEQMNTPSNQEKLAKLQTLSMQKKSLIGIAAIGIVVFIPMMFSGNTAPSTSDIEKVFAQEVARDSGFFNGQVSDVDVKHCEEISGRKLPTFNCTVEGTISLDMGALGSLFGGSSKASESFSDEFILVHGTDGWFAGE